MGQAANNDIYLKIGGVVVSNFFKDVQLNPGNDVQETTMGAGVKHKQRKPGLDDTTITITLGRDDVLLPTYMEKMKPGVPVEVEYGENGAVSGQPRHVQEFIFSAAPHTKNVQKNPVAFSLTGSATGEPSVDMYNGGVYS